MVKRSCSECPETFNLFPPADKDYNVAKEKPTSDDHIKRIYECGEGHRNTIYWHKNEGKIVYEKRKAEEAVRFRPSVNTNL
jgi:hypothetical protein